MVFLFIVTLTSAFAVSVELSAPFAKIIFVLFPFAVTLDSTAVVIVELAALPVILTGLFVEPVTETFDFLLTVILFALPLSLIFTVEFTLFVLISFNDEPFFTVTVTFLVLISRDFLE